METRKLIIAAGAVVCSLAACTREQLAPEPEECCTVTAISESRATKTDFSSDFALNWTEGDRIGVFNGELDNTPLTLTSGAGATSATFSLDGGSSFTEGALYACYPYTDGLQLDEDETVSVDLTGQNYEYDSEAGALKNSGKYFYMTGKSTVGQGSTDVDVFFRNPLAAFVFSLTNNGEETPAIKSVSVTAGSEVFGTAGKLDFADPDAASATSYASAVEVTLTDAVLEPGATLNIPLVLFPADLSGTELSFTVNYTDGEQTERTISKTVTGRELARNTLAGVRIDLGESDVLEKLQKILTDGGEFTLPCNVSGNFTVSASAPVTINLNGFTITNDPSEGDSDTFTVNPGSSLTIDGEGTVDNLSHGKAAVYNNGTVVLNGGIYTRSAENSGDNSFYVILNHGVMTIGEGVSVISSSTTSSLIHNAYYDYISADERTGYVEGTGTAYPSLKIDGGVFRGGNVSIKNGEGGLLEINGGVFPDATTYNVLNGHVANIGGGEFSGASSSVYTDATAVNENYHKAETTISGGTFNASVLNVSGDKDKAAISVKGGTHSVSTMNSMRSLVDALTEDADIDISLKEGIAAFSRNFAKTITFNVAKADIDLNGNAISYISDDSEAIIVGKGSVTIGNGSIKAEKLASDPSLSAIRVAGGASLTLNDMSVSSSSIGVNVEDEATLTLNNSTISDQLTISEDTELADELKVFSTDMTINLGGKTLALPRILFMGDGASYSVSGGTLEITGNAGGLAIEGQNSELTLDGVTINAEKLAGGENAISCGNNDRPDSYGNVLTVRNSTINSAQTGINLRRTQTLVVENSTITHRWFGITQNGVYPGSSVTVKDGSKISGFATGIYLSNNTEGAKNVLVVEDATIHSEAGSPIEVKKTDLTVSGATLESEAEPTYDFNGAGAGGSGYGIVLAGYESGKAYEGDYDESALTTGNTFTLKAGEAYKLFVYDGSNDHVAAN